MPQIPRSRKPGTPFSKHSRAEAKCLRKALMKNQRVKIILGPGSRIHDPAPARGRRVPKPLVYLFEGEMEVQVEDLQRYVQVRYLPTNKGAVVSSLRYVYEDPFGDLEVGEFVLAGVNAALAVVVAIGDDRRWAGSRKPIHARLHEVTPEEY